MISVESVSFTYKGSRQPALVDIDFEVPEGAIVGLLGPNGAGKTTLLSLLTGLNDADSGTVTVAGERMSRSSGSAKDEHTYVPQEFAFYPELTVMENLSFFAGMLRLAGEKKRRRIDHSIGFCRLADVESRSASQLSGGLKRRLNLAISLLSDSPIIYLDEPTVGIDPQSRAFILEQLLHLGDSGKTIIYASHYMEEVEQLCDQVAIIDHGRVLAQGRIQDLKSNVASHCHIECARELTGDEIKRIAPDHEVIHRGGTRYAIVGVSSLDECEAFESNVAAVGTSITRLSMGRPGLEEVFLNLTERELRD